MVSYEQKSIKSVFLDDDRHSHPISTEKISAIAQKRLQFINIDEETLYQISLSQKIRLWGVIKHNIFHILWLDEEHEVCPSNK